MNLNNLTIKSQEALQEAQQLASTNEQQAIETGHLLKAMLEVDENVVPFLLKKPDYNCWICSNKTAGEVSIFSR